MGIEGLRGTVSVFSAFVFGWQLWGAGRTFRLPAGEKPAFRHQLVPLTFIVVLMRSLSLPLVPGPVLPGCLGLAAALFLFEWARHSIRGRYFSYVFSRDVPGFLWTGGAFAYIRNPFYASYLLSAASVAVMFSDISVLLLFMLLFLFARAAARHEERKFLASPFREEYEAYARRTGRFVPGVGRLRS